MKDKSLCGDVDVASGWWVLTADQVDSRHRDDAVPQALAALTQRCHGMRLPFERTVGDELQGLTSDGGTLVDAVSELTRLGGWRIGVGLGDVDLPLPRHSREARGWAFIAARDAIGLARRQSTRIALAASVQAPPAPAAEHHSSAPDTRQDRSPRPSDKTVSALPYGVDDTANLLAHRAESALIVLRALLGRRTPEGWQVMQLLDTGLSHREVAQRLDISESAVSQRISRAQREEVARAQDLARAVLDDLRTATLARGDGRTASVTEGGQPR